MGIYKPGRPAVYHPNTNKAKCLPRKPRKYRILDENNALIYIGETNDLHHRTNEHIRSGKLKDSYSVAYQTADGRSTSATRRRHERQKIEQHSPRLNRSKVGEDRIAKH